jgi:hypothetical protein
MKTVQTKPDCTLGFVKTNEPLIFTHTEGEEGQPLKIWHSYMNHPIIGKLSDMNKNRRILKTPLIMWHF